MNRYIVPTIVSTGEVNLVFIEKLKILIGMPIIKKPGNAQASMRIVESRAGKP